MSTPEDPHTGEPSLSPKEAFSLLGNETRVAILEAMWDLWSPESDPFNRQTIPFSELRDAVQVRDSGNFNYHLSKLAEHYVARTDDGYQLTNAGLQVIRGILAGTVTEPVNVDGVDTGIPCSYCGETTILRYADDRLFLLCTGCAGHTTSERWPEGILASFEFAPAGLSGRASDEILQAGLTWYHAKTAPMMDGVCPECAGRVEESVIICPAHDPREDGICGQCLMTRPIWLDYECGNCRYWRIFSLERFLYDRSPVVSFFFEHGVDLTERWRETGSYLLEYDYEVESEDPLEVAIQVHQQGETLHLALESDYESSEPFGFYGGDMLVYRGSSLELAR